MDQLVGFLLHPPLYEIGKKIGKMLKYTPHFQSAFGTADSIRQTTFESLHYLSPILLPQIDFYI